MKKLVLTQHTVFKETNNYGLNVWVKTVWSSRILDTNHCPSFILTGVAKAFIIMGPILVHVMLFKHLQLLKLNLLVQLILMVFQYIFKFSHYSNAYTYVI